MRSAGVPAGGEPASAGGVTAPRYGRAAGWTLRPRWRPRRRPGSTARRGRTARRCGGAGRDGGDQRVLGGVEVRRLQLCGAMTAATSAVVSPSGNACEHLGGVLGRRRGARACGRGWRSRRRRPRTAGSRRPRGVRPSSAVNTRLGAVKRTSPVGCRRRACPGTRSGRPRRCGPASRSAANSSSVSGSAAAATSASASMPGHPRDRLARCRAGVLERQRARELRELQRAEHRPLALGREPAGGDDDAAHRPGAVRALARLGRERHPALAERAVAARLRSPV